MATLPQWIEARVIQKIATEAEWNEITLVPYKGEVCLVGDSGGKVVNIKIGDGINTFPNLEYMFDSIQQNVGYIAIESNALPTPLDDVAWGMVTGGTYTFGGVDVFTVPDGHWGIANYSSGVWSLVDMGELPTTPVTNIINQRDDIAISPKGVDDELNKFITPSYQIFDKEETKSSYFRDDGSRIASNTTMSVIIPLVSGETEVSVSPRYNLTGVILDRAQFRDENGVIISRILNADSVIGMVIPTGAVELALNIATQPSGEGPVTSPTDNNYVNNLMVNYGDTPLPWSPLAPQIKDSALVNQNNSIEDLRSEFDSILTDSPNLIDKSNIVFGRYNDSTGAITASTTTIRVPPVPYDSTKGRISYNSTAFLASTIANRLFYFGDANQLLGVTGKGESTQNILPPDGTKSIGINVTTQSAGTIENPSDNEWVNTLQLEYGNSSTSFRPYGKGIDGSRVINTANFPITLKVIDSNNFEVISLHDGGEQVRHIWRKNNRTIVAGQPPHLDTSWQATEIILDGVNIVQGSFNMINVVNLPNENTQHVGTGHGAEELLSARFFVDGKEVVIDESIGESIKGYEFSFDIVNRIVAVDAAATTNGSDVVIQLDGGGNPIPRGIHGMNGFIKGNSEHGFENSYMSLIDGLSFVQLYIGMHNTYPAHWQTIQLMNAENTKNDLATLEPVMGSTVSLAGYSDIMGHARSELGNRLISYSDNGRIFETHAVMKDNEYTKKVNVYINSTTKKAYIQPLVTTGVSNARGIPVDVLNTGDVIRGTVRRRLIL